MFCVDALTLTLKNAIQKKTFFDRRGYKILSTNIPYLSNFVSELFFSHPRNLLIRLIKSHQRYKCALI